MKKLIIAIALLGIIFVSGCVSSPTGMAVTEETQDNSVIYHDNVCRQDTDCMLVYCSETPEDLHCMCAADMLQDFKCTGKGRLITIKDSIVCGCSDGTCQQKV